MEEGGGGVHYLLIIYIVTFRCKDAMLNDSDAH